MLRLKTAIKISTIIIFMILLGGLFPSASAVFDTVTSEATPCCPIFAEYPDYPYGVDPYYMFPAYCMCPFLDDALARFEKWNLPASYWEYVIETQNSQCSTCTGISSTVSTFSYSNANLIIPEKDSLITAYDQISVSTAIKSKDQVLAKYLT
jgi:hypothetical protein